MSAPSQPVESFLARLEGVKRQGGFYRAFCPAYDDRKTPNLDIKEGEDGRVLLLCRAGCSTEEVVESIGLQMRDLFSSNVSSNGHGGGEGDAVSDPRPTPPSSGTLEAYAGAKRLPVEFLKSLGLADVIYSGSPAIRIAYRDCEGYEKAVPSSVRERLYLVRLDGAKDVSELHVQGPEHFKEKLRAAFKGARRWADEVCAVAEARSCEAWHSCEELGSRLTMRPVS